MAKEEILIVIPARFASERFPGKPLIKLAGSLGAQHSLIHWTWLAGVAALPAHDVIVATDDDRIADHVRTFGGRAMMTPSSARNGTERCAAVLEQLSDAPDFVINLQGDSPLVPPHFITSLVGRWRETGGEVVTAYVDCDHETEQRIIADHRAGLVGGTTLVTRSDGEALYFSKLPIPFRREGAAPLKLHLGLYGYTPAALRAYHGADPSALELTEGLEQLRFLELGIPVQTVAVPLPEGGLWEVNNPEDVPIVEAALRASGRASGRVSGRQ